MKNASLILLAFTSITAHAGTYNFGGNCPTQGAWTQQALQQTELIKDAINKLKDNKACKGLENVLTDLKAAAEELETPKGEENLGSRMESLPTEMGALQKTLTDGNTVNSEATTMLLNRTIEGASISSGLGQSTSLGAVTGGLTNATTAASTGGLSLLFKKLKGPTMKGLDLATKVMGILPQYDDCLIGQPSEGLAVLSGSVKIAAALSASGEGVGDKLGNAIASLMNMLRERKFTLALRGLAETEFWSSMSCLIESASKNYCDAQNAQELMKYSQDQYAASMNKIKEADRTSPNYDNPLEGYYLLVRELPKISEWLQKVQFGVAPKLSTDATFKNRVWEQVTDLTKSVNSLTGFFNEQMLFMRELTDVEAKRNHLFEVIHAIAGKMSGGGAPEGGGVDGTQFFSTTVNGDLMPFYLIGRNSIPEQCRVSDSRPVPQNWELWMKTSGTDGNFIADFQDPDKLAVIVETRMNEIIASASAKSSAYFRQRLVVDMPNLVSQTLTDQYMTVHKAFENVYNYLIRFEKKLNVDDMDVLLVPSVRQTKVKIQKFLKSYENLRALGIKMARSTTSVDDITLDATVNDAAKEVIDTVYNEFNILFQKDTYLTNRLTTFIEKDFAMRVRAGLNMSAYQQDLMVINQKNLVQKLTDIHGLNPTRAQQDLSFAQMINKRNIETIEEIFGDSFYRTIAKVKAVAEGKGEEGFKAIMNKRLKEDKKAFRKSLIPFYLPMAYISTPLTVATWLFSGTIVKSTNPDLYKSPKNVNHISGGDDKFGSVAQMQAMFCAQTLSFERRADYYDLCQNTSVKSFYSSVNPALDLDYADYLPNKITAPIKIKMNPEQTGKNICALNDFSIRNIVHWLKEQDRMVYGDRTVE